MKPAHVLVTLVPLALLGCARVGQAPDDPEDPLVDDSAPDTDAPPHTDDSDTDQPPAGSVTLGAPRIALTPWEGCALGPTGGVVCWGGDQAKNPNDDAITPDFHGDTPASGVSGFLLDWGAGLVLDASWTWTGASWGRRPGEAVADLLRNEVWRQVGTGMGDSDLCGTTVDGRLRCTSSLVDGEGDGWSWASGGWRGSACALHHSRGLVCWPGSNDGPYNRFGDLRNTHPDAIAVDVGNFTTCVITATREVACDGSSHLGVVPSPSIDRVRRLVVDTLACAIDDDDRLHCWPVVDGEEHLLPVPERALAMRVADVAVFYGTACAVGYDGELVCWGNDDYGRATAPAYAP